MSKHIQLSDTELTDLNTSAVLTLLARFWKDHMMETECNAHGVDYLCAKGEMCDGNVIHHDVELLCPCRQAIPHLQQTHEHLRTMLLSTGCTLTCKGMRISAAQACAGTFL